MTLYQNYCMKLAVVSDIHGNMPALEAVHKEVGDSVDGYVMLGDFVGLLGHNNEVVEFAIENGYLTVKGNHDISVVENDEGHVSNKELSEFEYNTVTDQLTDKHEQWVASQESYKEDSSNGIVLAHAQPTPEMSTGLEPRNPGLLKRNFTKVGTYFDDTVYNFVLTGHTHDQEALDLSKFGHNIVVMNPGSVGQSIKHEKAHYGIIDTETGEFETKIAEYDNKPVKKKLDELGVPLKWWKM